MKYQVFFPSWKLPMSIAAAGPQCLAFLGIPLEAEQSPGKTAPSRLRHGLDRKEDSKRTLSVCPDGESCRGDDSSFSPEICLTIEISGLTSRRLLLAARLDPIELDRLGKRASNPAVFLCKESFMSSQPRRRRLEVEHIGDVTVVNFVDRKILDEQNIQVIGDQLFSLVDQEGLRKLLLNFGNVEYLSSAALGKLITLNKKLQAAGGRLILCNIDPQIYEVFEITKLDKFFNIQKEEQSALQAF
jgi:anti-sigma B factor antagonist